MAKRRIYKNPPIHEAICEIRFIPGAPWDVLFPLRIYEALRVDYPQGPRQSNLIEAGFQQTIAPEGAPEQALLMKETGRLQFLAADGRRIVSLAENVLSVSDLRPYSGWEAYLPRIEKALSLYTDVAHPKGIVRIGVRYINRVDLPEGRVRLGEYFTSPPDLPDDEPDVAIAHVFSRIVSFYNTEPTRLTVTFATAVDAPDDHVGIILDLDVWREWADGELSVEGAVGEISHLRALEREAFEALITDKSREIFDA